MCTTISSSSFVKPYARDSSATEDLNFKPYSFGVYHRCPKQRLAWRWQARGSRWNRPVTVIVINEEVAVLPTHPWPPQTKHATH